MIISQVFLFGLACLVVQQLLNGQKSHSNCNHALISSFLLGLMPYLSSSSTTSFCLLFISSSKALRVDSSMEIVSLRDCLVSSMVYSTSTPPTTFQHLRSPLRGSRLVRTRLFSLRSSSSSMQRLKISVYSLLSLLQWLDIYGEIDIPQVDILYQSELNRITFNRKQFINLLTRHPNPSTLLVRPPTHRIEANSPPNILSNNLQTKTTAPISLLLNYPPLSI